jgi:hypothetical protein
LANCIGYHDDNKVWLYCPSFKSHGKAHTR